MRESLRLRPSLDIHELGREDEIIQEVVSWAEEDLERSYELGVGLFSAADGLFSREIWARDTALACLGIGDERMKETLKTLFKFQKKDGDLPRRVELKNHLQAIVFGGLEKYKSDLFRRKEPLGIYDSGLGLITARDSVSTLIIAFSRTFKDEPLEFWKDHFKLFELAQDGQRKYIDLDDGLIKGSEIQDWMDCVKRPGKLILNNILLLQSYKEMMYIAGKLRNKERFDVYKKLVGKMRTIIIDNFWNEDGYFQTSVTDKRLDVPANLFICLWGLFPTLSYGILEKVERLKFERGFLKAVDRPYLDSDLSWTVKSFGLTKYGHVYIYPWIAHLGILAKLKLVERLTGFERGKLLGEAKSDFLNVSMIHLRNGGLYEVLDDETLRPVTHKWMGIPVFKSSEGFLGSTATYLAVAKKLGELDLSSKLS